MVDLFVLWEDEVGFVIFFFFFPWIVRGCGVSGYETHTVDRIYQI